MLTMQNRKGFAMKPRKQFTSMRLHYLMEPRKNCFIMEIGSESPVLPFAAATTV